MGVHLTGFEDVRSLRHRGAQHDQDFPNAEASLSEQKSGFGVLLGARFNS
jgi:hypothetical protein